MTESMFQPLLYNAALLLAMVVAFDLARERNHYSERLAPRLLAGAALGAIGVAVMMAHLVWEPGIVFDTRSVLLSAAGLYFGWLPTLMAMAATAAYRVHLGGAAALTGVTVILTSGLIGLAWRRYRGLPKGERRWRELYLFGLLVHLAMLACMATLPRPMIGPVLAAIGAPVLLIYPFATMVLCGLLSNRLDHHQAQTALRESEERFRRIVETAREGIWQVGPDWHTRYANTRMEELLACPAGELTSRTVATFLREGQVTAWTTLSNALHSGRSEVRELRFVRCDGADLLALVSAVPVPGANGRFGGAVLMVTDITRQKHAEERFALAMRGANDGLYDWDMQTGKTYYSPRWKSMLGYDEEELPGEIGVWERLVAPEDRERALARLDDCIAGRRDHFAAQFRMRHKNGHWVEILSRGQLVRGPEGEPERLVGTHVDISERVRTEKQLRLAGAVIEQSSESIVVTDADASIVSVNPAFVAITGYPEREVLGQNPRFLKSGRHDRAFYRAMWDALKRKGQWQGEIWNRRKDSVLYPELINISAVRDADGHVTHYVGIGTDLSDIKRIQERLDFLDHHDPLTALPNRQLLSELGQLALRGAARRGSRIALFFLDLDQFKHINESLGHTVGDQLLIEVGGRLKQALRGVDTLARSGGDEFILLMEQLEQPSDAGTTAERLLEAVREPFTIDGNTLYAGVSIGIAIYPEDGTDITTLQKNADAALHQAKAAGRNTFRYFSQELAEAAKDRLALENLLRQALSNGELELHYQPHVTLRDERRTGVEALARWNSPTLGNVSPARFIPLAEETGLILPLGEWALRTACDQMRRWLEAGDVPDYVAVNVSAVQFARSDLVASVARALERSGIEPGRLELEITESIVLTDPERVADIVQQLRKLGVRIAIDDFGTGYSSLAYLKRLPVHRLKVDQAFVRDMLTSPSDAAIVRAIIAMGHTLGLDVLAEGVETAEHAAVLRKLGCDSAQGWHYGRPAAA